jgi:hypothetical protein
MDILAFHHGFFVIINVNKGQFRLLKNIDII